MRKGTKSLCWALAFGMLLPAVACGAAQTEAASGVWKQNSKGWWYAYSDGTYARSEWLKISGKWYYFNNAGYMAKGWKKIGGKWYFFKSNGAMKTGWLKSRGKWYLLGSNGAMKTGWALTDGKWYYLGADGAMKTGWLTIGGKKYYLDTDGAMVTGTIQIGDKQYSFDKSGVLVKETEVGGKETKPEPGEKETKPEKTAQGGTGKSAKSELDEMRKALNEIKGLINGTSSGKNSFWKDLLNTKAGKSVSEFITKTLDQLKSINLQKALELAAKTTGFDGLVKKLTDLVAKGNEIIEKYNPNKISLSDFDLEAFAEVISQYYQKVEDVLKEIADLEEYLGDLEIIINLENLDLDKLSQVMGQVSALFDKVKDFRDGLDLAETEKSIREYIKKNLDDLKNIDFQGVIDSIKDSEGYAWLEEKLTDLKEKTEELLEKYNPATNPDLPSIDDIDLSEFTSKVEEYFQKAEDLVNELKNLNLELNINLHGSSSSDE